jgi:hypothetical protein
MRAAYKTPDLPLRALAVLGALGILRSSLALALALFRRRRLGLDSEEAIEPTLLLRVEELGEFLCALAHAILARAVVSRPLRVLRGGGDVLEALLCDQELYQPVDVRLLPVELGVS